jgi:hypothetical protein
MSARKNVILPKLIELSMAQTGNTTPINIQYLDNVGIEFSWPSTDAPTGTIAIQCSNSYDPLTNPSGTFYTVTPSPTVTNPAGTAASFITTLSQLPYAWIRISYTRSSGGAGASLSIYLTAKEL